MKNRKLQTDFYETGQVSVTQAGYGPCVSIPIDNGEGPSVVYLYTDTHEDAEKLRSLLGDTLGRVQLYDGPLYEEEET